MSDFDSNQDELTGGLTPAETYDTIRLNIIYDIKDDVIGLIRKHFAWMALVVLSSGFAGPTLFMKEYIAAKVDGPLEKAQTSAIHAAIATENATAAAAQATAAATLAAEKASEAQTAIDETIAILFELQARADELDDRFADIQSDITTNAENTLEQTTIQLAPLKEQVTQLNSKVQVLLNTVAPRTAANFATAQATIKDTAEVKYQEFKLNSGVRVDFIVSGGHEHTELVAVIDELSKLGYLAKITTVKPGAKNAPRSTQLSQLQPEQWLVLAPKNEAVQTKVLVDLLKNRGLDVVEKLSGKTGVYTVIHADWAEQHQRIIEQPLPELLFRGIQKRLPGGQ